MRHYLTLAGRTVALVNLDPAADPPTSPEDAPAVDVRDLVSLDSVMAATSLGPNGGLLYCMDYLAENVDWLLDKLAPLAAAGHYFLFDTPGQAELVCLPGPLHTIVATLTRASPAYALVSVLLLDAHLVTEPPKFLAACVDALSAQLSLDLPHVAALAKLDTLAATVGVGGHALPFDLEFYARPMGGMHHLAAAIAGGDAAARGGGGGDDDDDDPSPPLPPVSAFGARYAKLTAGLCDVVEDYGLLSFSPLAIEDEAAVARMAALCDRAVGYAPGAAGGGVALPIGMAELDHGGDDLIARLEAKYLGGRGGGGEEEREDDF